MEATYMGLFDMFKVNQYKAEIQRLQAQNYELSQRLNSLGYSSYAQVQQATQQLQAQYSAQQNQFQNTMQSNERIKQNLLQEINRLEAERQDTDSKLKKSINKINKSKEIYKSIEYSINNFFDYNPELENIKLPTEQSNFIDEISPSVTLKLHHMDSKSLNKAFKDNDKQIEKVLKQYQGRYTTKANRAIYDLMVIALRAELQNILYNLKYDKLDNAIAQVKELSGKYLKIAGEGNQSISGTLTKFIGEIEYLFINAVKIEYNYYVKKEQARQEQATLREQMRQEAEERKALEQEKKRVEREEQKYKNELEKLKLQMQEEQGKNSDKLNARILELESQLANVAVQKESITKLQNGKAGNVYIISNLGSFGENVFKVGMTRRLDPQDRINELGSASVPFKFDVHSFIFSDDAVSLETQLHHALANKRVNKVNPRKEFFYATIDELEQLVNQIDPTAEFNRTMVAEEYNQSLSTTDNYTSDIEEFDDELEE